MDADKILEKELPVLYMMVGLAGSGKSTYSNKLSKSKNIEVFSSDELRKELYGDVNFMDKNGELFTELEKRIKNTLSLGNSAIYDATNISAKKRVAFLKYISKIACKKVCVIIYSTYEDCIKNNNNRERKVPDYVIENMMKSWNTPYYGEGWDEIKVEYTHDNFNGEQYAWLLHFPFNHMDFDQENSNHRLTLGKHCMGARIYISENESVASKYKKVLILAAMYHDCGKPFCKSFYNTKRELTEQAHYYNHENVGAYMILELLRVYRLSDIEGLQISVLINYHMRPYFAWDSKKAYNRDLQVLGQEMIDSVKLILDADLSAH